MSSGPGASGKPCPRLMASWSRASCDMTSKIVTGRSEKIVLISPADESVAGAARLLAGFGGKAGGFPAEHSACEVGIVRLAGSLRRERRRHRALAGTAGEHHR